MNTPDLYNLFQQFPKICTDSRLASGGSIFFALKGEFSDGNQHAEEALKKCEYAVIDNIEFAKDDRYILVDNVLQKLQRLAAYHRKRLGIPIIAITGTNGKTTTKELVTRVLSKKYNVAFTKGNLNNHIGVPLTLLSMNRSHDFGIVEMGANHLGEIELLCKISAPDFGIITNVGKAHIEGFGSLDGVKKAKSELFRYLYDNDGTAFINYDNEHLEDMNPPHNVIYYGTKEFTHCQGKYINDGLFLSIQWLASDELGSDDKEINWETDSYLIKTNLIGQYNFENVLAAICIGNKFGVEPTDINDAISSYKPDNFRSQVIETGRNWVLMDAYNANPTSMKASINSFLDLDFDNKMLIIGDMLELGTTSSIEHSVIFSLIDARKCEHVFFIGENFCKIAEGSIYACFKSSEEFILFLQSKPIVGYHILIKGSRGIKLEKVLSLL